MTITYAPPEAISHTEKVYGAHSDIWSLAAIAYFVLSEGDDLLPDVSPKRRAQLSTPAKCHAHLAKTLPKEVTPIIPLLVKMLSATPSTRPSLAQALDDPCWTKLAKFNRGSAPTATLLQPKRYYISDPAAWSQIQPHIGSIVACYARLLASAPARSLYLACDIFYRAAYLGWHPDRPGRSARIWRQLAFISIYLAEASRDILHHRDIEILADHFGLDGHLTDATPSWLADAVVAKALVGIVQPSWLYDTLASKQQVSLGVNRWLLDPETYLGWDQKRTAPIIPSKPPYTGDVASLKIFWQDI